ncbi:hypothetical protein HOLleu_22589 [Holothuria leucospilota]|uniref:Ig-like domain-containing protein n=1 Tax=Holothuria leucospilota TaxID=206669 RepID=A0A9Q1BZ92_HOLLE|nr:hypothetical protein HOLleu_22589 [Holothuria leucospilota]
MWLMALSLTLVLAVSFVSPIFAVTTCPNKVLAEKGTDFNITCTIDENTVDLYWYKGKAEEQDLVGKLEMGSVSISQRYRDSYDIGQSGSLRIRNAGLSHESLYTLLTFDSNNTPEEDEVILNITISPYPSCPIISDCTSCTKCYLNNLIGSGSLTCRVEGVRLLIHLSWNATLQTGVGFFERQPVEIVHGSAKSWDISVTLDYNIMNSCGAKAILHGMAEGSSQVLQSTVSTVEINIPCNISGITDNPDTSEKSALLLIVLVVLVLILIVGVLIICCIFCRKHREPSGVVEMDQQDNSDLQILSMGSLSIQCLAFEHVTIDASGNATTISAGAMAFTDHKGVASSNFLALE